MRFCFCAGVKSDGSIKVRAVDDMSSSHVNDATRVLEKLTYDSLDLLFEVLQDLTESTQVIIVAFSCAGNSVTRALAGLTGIVQSGHRCGVPPSAGGPRYARCSDHLR